VNARGLASRRGDRHIVSMRYCQDKAKSAGAKYFGKPLTDDPDDAPELREDFFGDGELRHGDRRIRRGRRPINLLNNKDYIPCPVAKPEMMRKLTERRTRTRKSEGHSLEAIVLRNTIERT
jgi:hypothetical protein